METLPIRLTYIGGSTALIELGGLRLLTDPTFDPAGTEYRTPLYVLRRTMGPAVSSEALGVVDVVLLSHDHHFDNLDRAGRELLNTAALTVTTRDGAARLGGRSVGLAPWEHLEVPTRAGRSLRITATPARHGPSDGDRGPVIGFVLAFVEHPESVVYVSGDTVWYDGIAEVSRRFTPAVAVLFGGAARVREVGPAHLTLTADEMVATARAFARAIVVPLHFEGWAHFSESRPDIEQAFARAGLTDRLRWPAPGQAVELALA